MTLWFLARAAGLMALVAATAAVCLGTATSGSAPAARLRRRGRRLVMQYAHRSASVVTLALLALHAVLLIVDSHVDLSLSGALVPFTAGYRGFGLGLGTIAFYCFGVVALSGAIRGRLAGSARAARWWRPVHALAYAAWPLALAHGLLAGTDTTRWWAWSLYGGSVLAVTIAVWARVAAENRHAAAPLAASRRSHRNRRHALTTGRTG